ncbi:MAG: exonuclease domain-containing protein [Flavobacteriaceae bacterium]|nr:exonuclease domain-containing protein [Flavobacteriaceae bacterium]
MTPYAIIDIEATGGKAGTEKIIDIFIYRFDGNEVLDQFGSRVNPQRSIDKYVQKLTGITEKMVKGAPKFYELAKRIIEITENCIIVGHGVDFDYRMLRQEFRELGYNYERKTLDTLDLSKKLLPDAESYSLGKLSKSLGIPVNFRHTAEGDTRITLELFKILLQKDVKNEIMQSYAIDSHKSRKQISKLLHLEGELPNETGNFYFLNSDKKLIFTSSAKNIRNDVNEIFTSNGKNEKRLQSQVQEITTELTGSFLIAILKENQQKKATKNLIQLRKKYFLYGLFINLENNEFIVEKVDNYPKQPLLLFHNKRKAYRAIQELHHSLQIDTNLPVQEKAKLIRKKLAFPAKNLILVDKGRNSQEKSFIEINDGKLKAYGFFTLFNQLENDEIRQNLRISLPNSAHNKTLIKTFLHLHQFLHIITFDDENPVKIPII